MRLRERPNQTCSQCHRPFALDPKTNVLKAHDIMVARAADKLSDGGKLRYSGVQLWYALSRKALKDRPTGIGGGFGGAIVVLVVAGFCGLDGVNEGNYAIAAAAALVWLVVIAVAVVAVANRRASIPTIEMPLRWSEFAGRILTPWHTVYQSDPPGLARAAAPRRTCGPTASATPICRTC